MNQESKSVRLPSAAEQSFQRLASSQKHLLVWGGISISALIATLALISLVASIDHFHRTRAASLVRSEAAVEQYLAQRSRGYSRTRAQVVALWTTRHDYLEAQGRAFAAKLGALPSIFQVHAGRGSKEWTVYLPPQRSGEEDETDAYLGLVVEASMLSSSTTAEITSPGSLISFVYTPNQSMLATTGIERNDVLRGGEIRDAIRRLSNQPTAIVNDQSFLTLGPFDGKPSLIGIISPSVGGKPFIHIADIVTGDTLRRRLLAITSEPFVLLSADGQVVVDTEPTKADRSSASAWQLAVRRQAGHEHEPSRNLVMGDFIVTREIGGLNAYVAINYSWQDIAREIWREASVTGFSVLALIAGLWIFIRRIEKKALRPAMVQASRVFESEQLNRLIIDTSPVGLSLVDMSTLEVYEQNDRARALIGTALDPSQANTMFQSKLRHLAGVPHEPLSWSHHSGTADTSRTVEYTVAATTHRSRPVALLVIRDITAQYEIEEQLRAARDAAEAASNAKSSFVSSVSHEVRTPLNGLLGHLELLAGEELPDRLRDRVERISHSAASLLTVINDVLDLSKLDAGVFDRHIARMSVLSLIEDVAQLYEPLARTKGIELRVSIATDVPGYVHSDAARLRQILNNLVGNAVKFTLSGHVTLTANRARTTEQGLCFEIVDSGPGVLESRWEEIFEPFAQENVATGGTGLGLTLSRRMAQLLDGTLEPFRPNSSGIGFRLSVPASHEEHAGWRHGAGEICVRSGSPFWTEELSRWLNAWGYEVRILPPFADDAMLTDLIMEYSMPIHGRSSSFRTIQASTDGPLEPRWRAGKLTASLLSLRCLHEALNVSDDSSVNSFLSSPPSGPLAELQPSILVVDDHPANRILMQDQLSALHYRVHVAESAEAALAYCADYVPDALLTDLNMPGTDGYRLTDELRSRGFDFPIIAVTADALARNDERLEQAGFDDILTKPFTLKELGDCLASWLALDDVLGHTPITPPPLSHVVSEAAWLALMGECERDIATLLNLLAERNIVGLKDAVHRFAGVLYLTRQSELGAECKALEFELSRGVIDSLRIHELAQRISQACSGAAPRH